MNNSDGNAISWIEDICQKIEAISIEAENQVLSATDSIISFCSHAMDDLLPPVSDDPMTPDAGPVIFDEAGSDSHSSDKKYAGDDEIESNDENKDGLDIQVSEQQLDKLSLDEKSSVLVNEYEQLSTSNTAGDNETESNSDDNQGLDVQVSEQQLGKLSLDDESYGVVNEFGSFSTYKPAGDDGTESHSDDNEALDALVYERRLGVWNLEDESCVLAYESEPTPATHNTGKRRSYKRKIRDILNQKKRFSSMNRMHQITDCSSLKSEKIVDSDSMDSDWEFV